MSTTAQPQPPPQSPPRPSPPSSVPPQVQQHDREAWLFETAAVTLISAALSARLFAITANAQRAWLAAFGDLTSRQRGREVQHQARSLAEQLAHTRIDVADSIVAQAQKAWALGVEQGAEEADTDLGALWWPNREEVARVARQTSQVASERLEKTTRLLETTQSGSWRTMANLAADAQQAANVVKRDASTLLNTELNAGVTAVANQVGAQRLWIAERNSCLHCAALSGHVVDVGQEFPIDLTFAAKPLTWVPISAGGLTGPPRHPSCRCRCMPWFGARPSDTIDLPTALRREAERSVLNGVALPSEPSRVRVDAADRLLALVGSRSPSGWQVPASVKDRARRAVKRGTFTK